MERIKRARLSSEKAGQWIRDSKYFEGAFGLQTLSAFADCIIEATRAKAAKGAPASEKWSVTLEWSQGRGYGSGILALNFGYRYLASCRHDELLNVLICPEFVRQPVRPEMLGNEDAFSNLPGAVMAQLDPETMKFWPGSLRPAFAEACNLASSVYRKLQSPAHRAHAPGLLAYLRKVLNRPEIPDPAWALGEL